MEALYHLVEGGGQWSTICCVIVLLCWESGKPFFVFFSGSSQKRITHGAKNVALGALNVILVSVVFVSFWHLCAAYGARAQIGLLRLASFEPLFQALLAVLLLDLWTYWWHRLNHRVTFLWRFHRVHHSDSEMDVTTSYRFHLGEIALSSLLRGGVIIAIGAELWHVALYETLMFPVVLFHHANISLPEGLDRLLRIVLVTPGMHKVHHSRVQKETDSNYTSLLSVWDRIFGSYRTRTNLAEVHLGLKDFDETRFQRLWGMLLTPFLSPKRKKG